MARKRELVLFYGGFMSQWYPSPFVVEGNRYNCAEQFMMHRKAQLFGDLPRATAIMAARTPREQKMLGRAVTPFDQQAWEQVARDVVFRGNVAKFAQNGELLKRLLDTGSAELAEASPTDRIWGIGLAEDDPRARDRRNWDGRNWLGITLMAVRDALRVRAPA